VPLRELPEPSGLPARRESRRRESTKAASRSGLQRGQGRVKQPGASDRPGPAADQESGSRLPAPQENVVGAIGVVLAGNQIGRGRDEGHPIPVGADLRRRCPGRTAIAATQRIVGRMRDQSHLAGQPVEKIDIALPRSRLADNQVLGRAVESREAAVAVEARIVAGGVADRGQRHGGHRVGLGYRHGGGEKGCGRNGEEGGHLSFAHLGRCRSRCIRALAATRPRGRPSRNRRPSRGRRGNTGCLRC
jgi:hypothetical protein